MSMGDMSMGDMEGMGGGMGMGMGMAMQGHPPAADRIN